MRRTLLLSYFEGGAVALHSAITVGLYPVGFALLLGANDFQVGILGAFSFLATVFGFLAAYLVEATGARKSVMITASFLGRALWLAVAPLPFLHLDSPTKVWIFLALAGISAAGGAMGANAWLAWFTDLVPGEIRGRYFGKRFAVVSAVNLAGAFGAGIFLDIYKGRGAGAVGYEILFVMAFVLAVISAILLLFHHEGERPQAKGFKRAWAVLGLPLKDKNYRILLVYFAIWSGVNGMASPFWGAHMFKNLGLSYTQVSIYTAIAGVFVLAFQALWGWIMDRTGGRAVLKFCSLGVVLTPLLWPLASPGHLWPIWTDAALSGIFWPGINLASIYLLMENRGESGDSVMAIFYFITGLLAFLSGLGASVVAERLAGLSVVWHGLLINNFIVLFLATAALRLTAVLVMPSFAEHKKAPARGVPREMFAFVTLAALAGKDRLFRGRGRLR